jgi:hypothetical protein
MPMPPSKKSPPFKPPNLQCDGNTHRCIANDVEKVNEEETFKQTRFRTEQLASLTIKSELEKGR